MVSREALIVGGFVGFALIWVYGSDNNASLELGWFLSLTAAHFLTGVLVAKWRVLLLPVAVVVASIPAPTPAGDDSSTLGIVLLYEFFVGLPVLLVSAGVGRTSRGRALLKDPDPWG